MGSYLITVAENAAVQWPRLWEIVQALGVGWFVLAVWAAFGVVLAVLSRGMALAIGLGILYTFVIEGVFSGSVGSLDRSWVGAAQSPCSAPT